MTVRPEAASAATRGPRRVVYLSYDGMDEPLGRSQVLPYLRRLAERRGQVAGTMSGGEQQMLALARGLATRPALLMLDELSMGLAPLIVEELYAQVAAIAASGVSIVVVEQFARTVLGVADIAAVLVHGRIGAVGPPAEIEAALSTAYLGATVPSSPTGSP